MTETVQVTAHQPFMTRLVRVTERTETTLLGHTETGEPMMVEPGTGRIALWLCGGWLHGTGTVTTTHQRAHEQRVQRQWEAAHYGPGTRWARAAA